jgi:hypothetical protein
MQDAMPPEEMDEDTLPPPAPTKPQTAARGGPLPSRAPSGPPGAINSQPLAPPPGSVANAPGTGPSVPPIGEAATGAGQMKPPAPSSTAPQPGDEVVTEMPAVKIPNPVAVFAGLDKITGRIIAFDVPLNEKVQFGALQVTPRVCYTRPATEATNTDGFVDVDEVTLQGETKRIFTGWMFAASPGLHAVEHPIYDVWLTGCKGGNTQVADTQPSAAGPTSASATPGSPARAQQPPSATPSAGGTSSGTPKPPAPQRQSAQQSQPQPGAQAPARLQPPPPPPGSAPVQWPPRQ